MYLFMLFLRWIQFEGILRRMQVGFDDSKLIQNKLKLKRRIENCILRCSPILKMTKNVRR